MDDNSVKYNEYNLPQEKVALFLKLEINATVVIQNEAESLIGNVEHVNYKMSMLELKNVYEMHGKYKYSTPQFFSPLSVLSIRLASAADLNVLQALKEDEVRQKFELERELLRKCNGVAVVKEIPKPVISLTEVELNLIQEQLQKTVLIQQTDKKYHYALQDMRESKFISLIVEPSYFGRYHNTSVLVAATENNVYIFDIIAFGTIFKEFKQILEATWPRKIVHDSRRINHHLFHRQQTKLAGIFDTFVMYCKMQGVNKFCTLIECIEMNLGIPKSYFQKDLATELVQTKSNSVKFFQNRPLTSDQQLYLAKIAIYQYKLYNYFMLQIIFDKNETNLSNFAERACDDGNDDDVDELLEASKLCF